MARIVMKFGGTSVADLDRIRNVAARVKREVDAGNQVAVVVSAMAGATNQLVGWCQALSPLHDAREYDTVVSTGEQVTTGLLGHRLAGDRGGGALLARLADPHPHRQRPRQGAHPRIDGEDLIHRMEKGHVAVVAGFQGIAPNRRITTLGRGGSDTSAVALAAALKADRCDIYTDVDGVYTTDPRIVPQARKLAKIAYEEMLELASVGAKVLQTRSVELAMNERVRVRVLSSFKDLARRNDTAARWSWMRTRSWKKRTSPASPIRGTSRRSRCAGYRTGRASPPPSSARWRSRTSTWT